MTLKRDQMNLECRTAAEGIVDMAEGVVEDVGAGVQETTRIRHPKSTMQSVRASFGQIIRLERESHIV